MLSLIFLLFTPSADQNLNNKNVRQQNTPLQPSVQNYLPQYKQQQQQQQQQPIRSSPVSPVYQQPQPQYKAPKNEYIQPKVYQQPNYQPSPITAVPIYQTDPSSIQSTMTTPPLSFKSSAFKEKSLLKPNDKSPASQTPNRARPSVENHEIEVASAAKQMRKSAMLELLQG